MDKTRRVALTLELDWPLERHLGVFLGVQQYAARHPHWQCIIDEFAAESLPTDPTQPIPYDGIIARATSGLAERAERCGVPVVNVFYHSPAQHLPAVLPDYTAVGRHAAEHLLQHGLRNFACLICERLAGHRAGADGFASVLAPDIPCQRINFKHYGETPHVARELAEIIAEWTPPIGVFFTHGDFAARSLVEVCRQRGLRVPRDVSVIVGTNERAYLQWPAPSISAVSVSYRQIGFEAAALLDGLMAGQPRPDGPVVIPPIGVVPRQSTNAFVVDDELVEAAMDHITEHFGEELAVTDVVRRVAASRRTLERRFRKHLGYSVAAAITRVRIDRAKQLLIESDTPIKLVARQCGFQNAPRFYEAFQRVEGDTPKNCRVASEQVV